jgi:hypothetical protein
MPPGMRRVAGGMRRVAGGMVVLRLPAVLAQMPPIPLPFQCSRAFCIPHPRVWYEKNASLEYCFTLKRIA